MVEGSRTTDLPVESAVDTVLANVTSDGQMKTRQVPAAVLAAQLSRSAGAIVAKMVKATLAHANAAKAQLGAGDVVLVVFDDDLALRGQYALEGGNLVKKGELTETQAEYWADQAKQVADEFGDLEGAVLAATTIRNQTAAVGQQKVDAAEAIRVLTNAIHAATIALRDQAQLAADASFALGPKFPNVAAGLAAVGENVDFLVVGAGEVSATPYKKVGGVAVQQGPAFPSIEAVNRIGPIATVELAPESGYLRAWVNSENEVIAAITTAGKFLCVLDSSVQFPAGWVTQVQAAIFPSTDLVFWGDSMTAGAGGGGTSIPSTVAAILGRPALNLGIGGQQSGQIAGRQGGVPILVTVSGDQIPASGAVAVSAKSVNILFNSGSFTGTSVGMLAGIPGTMSTNGTGDWTFTRTASGSVTACPPNSRFTPDQVAANLGKTIIIGAGRNDDKIRSAIETIRNNILAMADILTAKQKNFLVWDVPNSNTETTATNPHILAAVKALNAELRDIFGPRYVGMRDYMVNFAIYDAVTAGLLASVTADDLADIAVDCVPRSLRSDPLHWNGIGYAMAGRRLAQKIRAMGY